MPASRELIQSRVALCTGGAVSELAGSRCENTVARVVKAGGEDSAWWGEQVLPATVVAPNVAPVVDLLLSVSMVRCCLQALPRPSDYG